MILAIVGPTGVGKTKLSVALAKKFNAVIINCDAMQVYKDLNIGTAKVTEEEKEGIDHYLFDIKDVSDEYTVYDYQKDARKLIEKFKDRNIIFVGGTGLYLKSALYDYRFYDEVDNKKDYSKYTNDELYKMVLEKDPNSLIHPNNRVRMERFLDKINIDKIEPIPLYKHMIIGLTTDRDVLYDRINKRVDVMVKAGLLEEAKRVYDTNIRSKAVMTPIGYKELFPYFDGSSNLEICLDKIKQNSRHYAKRQYTFFNHQLPVKWFDVDFDNFDNTVNEVLNYVSKE